MKNCKRCGDPIKIGKDTEELLEEGFISMCDIEYCDACAEENAFPNHDFSYEQYSDADPGL